MCRVKEDKALITLEFSGRHDKDSHKGLGSGRISGLRKSNGGRCSYESAVARQIGMSRHAKQ